MPKPTSVGPNNRHTGFHDPCLMNAGYAIRSAAINNGRASPTEAFEPYKSASRKTDTIEIPLKPDFDRPIQNAANSATG